MAPSSVNVEVIMKRTILLSVSLLCAVTLLFAQPIAESPQEPAQIAVMAGPTGFSSAGLSRFLGEDTYTLSVYPSPNEVIARLANGEVDVAALPSNVAATLYNRGVKIQVAAVIGDGMLSVLSSDPSVADASDLIGKTIQIGRAHV